MKHTLIRLAASAMLLVAPAVALGARYDTNYDYNDYDYNYDYDYDSDTADAAAAAFGIGFLIFFGFMFLVGVAACIFTIWMIVDAAKRDFDQKALWIILMVFFGFIPAIIYFFMVKRKNVTGSTKPATTTPPAATPPAAK